VVVDLGVKGPEPGSGGHIGRTGPEGSDVVADPVPDCEGKEEGWDVVAGQCLGETSLMAPSVIVDQNIPGIWSRRSSHIISRADISRLTPTTRVLLIAVAIFVLLARRPPAKITQIPPLN